MIFTIRLTEEEVKFIQEVLSRLPNSTNSFGLFQKFSRILSENSKEEAEIVPENSDEKS